MVLLVALAALAVSALVANSIVTTPPTRDFVLGRMGRRQTEDPHVSTARGETSNTGGHVPSERRTTRAIGFGATVAVARYSKVSLSQSSVGRSLSRLLVYRGKAKLPSSHPYPPTPIHLHSHRKKIESEANFWSKQLACFKRQKRSPSAAFKRMK